MLQMQELMFEKRKSDLCRSHVHMFVCMYVHTTVHSDVYISNGVSVNVIYIS